MHLPSHDVEYSLKSGHENEEWRFHIWPDSTKRSTDPPAIVSGKNYLKRQTFNVSENQPKGMLQMKNIY